MPTWATLGVNTWTYTIGKVPGQDFLRGGLWSSAFTGVFYVDTPSMSQDFDWTQGPHSISFGGSWTRPHPNGDGTFQANGNMGFSGIFTSGTTNANGGLNMADFVLGYPTSYRGGGSQINNAWVHSIGLYVADVWRVNRRVTLNYGLRWEPYLSAKDAQRIQHGVHPRELRQGHPQHGLSERARSGWCSRAIPGFPNDGGNTWNKLAQFAPRVGLVWDPTGDTVQTIRAGGGIYYDSPKLWETAHHMLNPPFGNTVDALAPDVVPRQAQPERLSARLRECLELDARRRSARRRSDTRASPSICRRVTSNFPLNGVYVSMPVNVNPM